MPPEPRLAIVATVQQAISSLLTTYEPEFLQFGHSLFVAFATILIVWQGVRIMLSNDSLGDHLFGFAKLLLFISFGYAIVAFYESPTREAGVLHADASDSSAGSPVAHISRRGLRDGAVLSRQAADRHRAGRPHP